MTKKEKRAIRALVELLKEKQHNGQLPVARKLITAFAASVNARWWNKKKAGVDKAIGAYLELLHR